MKPCLAGVALALCAAFPLPLSAADATAIERVAEIPATEEALRAIPGVRVLASEEEEEGLTLIRFSLRGYEIAIARNRHGGLSARYLTEPGIPRVDCVWNYAFLVQESLPHCLPPSARRDELQKVVDEAVRLSEAYIVENSVVPISAGDIAAIRQAAMKALALDFATRSRAEVDLFCGMVGKMSRSVIGPVPEKPLYRAAVSKRVPVLQTDCE